MQVIVNNNRAVRIVRNPIVRDAEIVEKRMLTRPRMVREA